MCCKITLVMIYFVRSMIEFIQNQNELGYTKFRKVFAIITVALFCPYIMQQASAQYCNGAVPSYTVNLTGSPSGSWISPNIVRNDNCCGTTPPDVCVQFVVTLDPLSQGISFNIYSGAAPSGSMFYQVNCGPPVPVGQPICLSGVGPHYITFCKPGNNVNQYIITSLGPVSISSNIILNDGCSGIISAYGYDETTITWTSVYPGPVGAYNSYLSCASGCDTTTVTAQPGFPPYVDFMVCGTPMGGCSPPICDTVRVYFNPTLAANIIPINPTVCFGSPGTWITANGSGGTAPYNYTWSTGATTQSIFVGAGTYTVTLGDVSNCPPTTATVTVTAFANPITANAGPDITVCAQNPTVILNGSVTGATGGIWLNGGGVFSPNNTTLNASYTPSAAEITNGSVTLTLLTTGNGTCPADSDDVTIFIAIFDADVLMSAMNVSCFGMSNGSATASVSAGTPPFSYSWTTTPAQTTATATGLVAGNYTVTITDGNGCTQAFSVSVTEPSALNSAITSSQNVSCYGGSNGTATVSSSGGIFPHAYAWNTTPVQTTPTATNLSVGSYAALVTDANGCTTSSSVAITQPSQLTSVISSSANVSCYGGNNGSASASVSGGAPPYSYTWNSTPVQTTQTATNLPAGNYTVTTTDGNGCSIVSVVTITQPPALAASVLTVNNVACFGGNNGFLTTSASGGIGPYGYSWNTTPVQNTQSATGLTAGNYTVTVTDNNGCIITASATVTQPPQLTVSIPSPTNVSCNGGNNGSATTTSGGGVGPYSYSWNTSPIQLTPTVTGLTAGTYTVTVTDNNNCTATASVTITQPAPLTLSTAGLPVSCFGQCNGQGIVIPSGGSPTYSYNWLPTGGNNPSATGLCAGNYTIAVADGNGCTASTSVVITQPAPLVTTAPPDTTICGGASVTLTASASGGNGGYSYLWNNGLGWGNPQTVTPPATTTYVVTATDGAGCNGTPDTVIINVLVLTAGNIAMSPATSICNGGSVQVSASVSGNTGTVSYSWSGGLPAGPGPYSVYPTTTTIYTVTVTNQCGVTAQGSVTITVNPLPQISLTPQTGVGCDEVVIVFADTNSANAGSSYWWTFGDGGNSSLQNPSHPYTSSGTFNVSVTVTSPYGCSSTATTIIITAVNVSPTAAFIAQPQTTSIIDPQIQFVNNSINAVNYLWDFGDGGYSSQTNPLHTYASKGTYVVKLFTTGVGGCMDTAEQIVIVEPEFTFYIPNAFTPNGDGNNEIFSGQGAEITEFSMMIFDRWGEMIFKTNDLYEGWNGKANGGNEIAQQGVYVYRIELKDFKNKSHAYNGHVSLIK